jgi:hypothetical protein
MEKIGLFEIGDVAKIDTSFLWRSITEKTE